MELDEAIHPRELALNHAPLIRLALIRQEEGVLDLLICYPWGVQAEQNHSMIASHDGHASAPLSLLSKHGYCATWHDVWGMRAGAFHCVKDDKRLGEITKLATTYRSVLAPRALCTSGTKSAMSQRLPWR